MPDVYLSQRWIAPPDWVAARPATDFPHSGGEYANLYWSQGEPQALQDGIRANGQRLSAMGRSGPMPLLTRTWGGRLHLLSAAAKPEPALSAEAVACLPNTGLIVEVNQVQSAAVQDYDRSAAEQRIPALLAHSELAASFSFAPLGEAEDRVHFFFALDADPLAALALVRALAPSGAQRKFLGVYRLNPPGDYSVYE